MKFTFFTKIDFQIQINNRIFIRIKSQIIKNFKKFFFSFIKIIYKTITISIKFQILKIFSAKNMLHPNTMYFSVIFFCYACVRKI